MGWMVPSNPSCTTCTKDGIETGVRTAKHTHTENDKNENLNTESNVRHVNKDIQVYNDATKALKYRDDKSVASATGVSSLAWSVPPHTKLVHKSSSKTKQSHSQSTVAPSSTGSGTDVRTHPALSASFKTVGWVASKLPPRRKVQLPTDDKVKGESANDTPTDAACSKKEAAVIWIGGSKWIVPPPCKSGRIAAENTDEHNPNKRKRKAQREPLGHRDTNVDTDARVRLGGGGSNQSTTAPCTTLLPFSVPGWIASSSKPAKRKLECNPKDKKSDKQHISVTKHPGGSVSLSALKDGWVARRVKGSNRKYYFHRNLSKSVWQRPHNVWVAYEGEVDGKNTVYFHHSGTGERSWTRPAAFASTLEC